MKRPLGLRTWVEIDKKAIENNYRVFRNLIPKKTKLMAVIKSNAYGHGLVDFAKEVSSLGADWLCVDSVVEANTLRKEGLKKPILVLGYTLPELIAEGVENDISFAISSFEQLKTLESIKTTKPKRIHIKVDTGMGRQGFLEKDLLPLISQLKKSKETEQIIEGLFSHLASAKNPAFPQSAKSQVVIFQKWVQAFKKENWKPMVHILATGGAIIYPEFSFDAVRIGIGLYGIWPSKETEYFAKDKISLLPALSWKTLISEIKELPKGARIGYDGTELLEKDTKVAVCPIGYWHGFPRALSSIGRVLIRGKIVRVLGRVSMDMIVIDITNVENVEVEDEVVLIDKERKEEVGAEFQASLIEMSPYELITRINPLIKRFYI